MCKASLLRISLRNSKRSATRRKRPGPKHVASETAVAAVTICRNHDRARFGGRDLRTHLPTLRTAYTATIVFSCFPLLDFPGTAIDAVTINSRTHFGIATAF